MKAKVVFCLLILFSFFSPCIYAQTDDDMSLFEIDRLIRKTEYDEALRQLNVYIEKNPENFDNAQIRIKRIMNAKKQYSILAEKLIALIQTDPGNNQKIYEITAQLEKFERHPSDQKLQFIADLKKSAEFNYFRSQFLEIQTETAQSSQKGDYIAAIEKAKSGFWLYKDSFYEKWEDNPEVTEPVDKMVASLNSHIDQFEEKNYLPKIEASINDFIKAVSQDQYEQANEKLIAVESALRRLNDLRELIILDGITMQSKFEELKKIDSDATDASYLPFMFRFVFGVDTVADSGILGAVDSQFDSFVGQMNEAVYDALTKKYNGYSTAIDDRFASEVKKYVALENKVLNLYKIAEKQKDYVLDNPFEDYYVIADYAGNLSDVTVKLVKNNNQIDEIAGNQKIILQNIQNEDEIIKKTEYITQLFNSNAKIGSVTGGKEDQLLTTFDWYNNYKELERGEWDGLTQKYNDTLNSMFVNADGLLIEAWKEITTYYRQNSDYLCEYDVSLNKCAEIYRRGFFTKIPQSIINEINADVKKALAYQNKFNENPELDFGINYSYPNIALNIAAFTQKDIEQNINTLDSYKSVLTTNYQSHEEWKNDKTVISFVNDTNEYLEKQKEVLSGIKNEAANQMALAQNRITSSTIAKNEGDIRYNEAENALRQENFEVARKKLQDALTKYDESLNSQNDENLRIQVDAKLQNLGERIAKSENEIVVREVRDLKTRAKDAYFNGRFDDAEKYLNQAKNRWAVTNITEDEEITNLLNFVNTAISMKTGREILPSAPQYPEMSQLLNMAYQYFDEGSRKIGENNREEGLADLDQALNSIQKLQYVYPLNQEAAILTLRINRLKDPQKFQEEFAQKVEMAKMMCQSKETRQEGYANLLDYYQLNPNYKGLKQLIYDVEIEIGIRQKPVDNSGTAKARRLISDAQSIYSSAGNNVKKLEQALDKINQALTLLPDNSQAMDLKDKITLKIGGNTSTVLSTEDERLYQLAIQRLQNNNVVGANAIVEQLLKKPQNAYSQKIKDLKNKIDARS